MAPAGAFYGVAGLTCRRMSSPLRSSSHARGPVPLCVNVLEEMAQPVSGNRSSITVEQVAYKDGAFIATGCLLTGADPDVVYRVLTDYGELSR